MESINNEVKKPKKNTSPYLIVTFILFFIVLATSCLLWFLTNNLSKQIEDNNLKIADYSKQINDLKSNTNILSYDIINDNKAEIKKSIDNSKAQKYIDDIIGLGKKYSVIFSWFAFDWEKIDTNASVESRDANKNSMQYVSEFIAAFRDNNNNIPYNLDPITSIWWNNIKRSFVVSLKIK